MVSPHVALLAWAGLAVASGERVPPLRLEQTIPLPGIQGRIDHLALDVQGQRLFVAALGNDSVEILDLARKRTFSHEILQAVCGASARRRRDYL